MCDKLRRTKLNRRNINRKYSIKIIFILPLFQLLNSSFKNPVAQYLNCVSFFCNRNKSRRCMVFSIFITPPYKRFKSTKSMFSQIKLRLIIKLKLIQFQPADYFFLNLNIFNKIFIHLWLKYSKVTLVAVFNMVHCQVSVFNKSS